MCRSLIRRIGARSEQRPGVSYQRTQFLIIRNTESQRLCSSVEIFEAFFRTIKHDADFSRPDFLKYPPMSLAHGNAKFFQCCYIVDENDAGFPAITPSHTIEKLHGALRTHRADNAVQRIGRNDSEFSCAQTSSKFFGKQHIKRRSSRNPFCRHASLFHYPILYSACETLQESSRHR